MNSMRRFFRFTGSMKLYEPSFFQEAPLLDWGNEMIK